MTTTIDKPAAYAKLVQTLAQLPLPNEMEDTKNEDTTDLIDRALNDAEMLYELIERARDILKS